MNELRMQIMDFFRSFEAAMRVAHTVDQARLGDEAYRAKIVRDLTVDGEGAASHAPSNTAPSSAF